MLPATAPALLLAASRLQLSLASLKPSNGFLSLNPPQLTLGYKPALATHRAQDAALGDLLSKALKELLLGFVGSTHYCRHVLSPPSV